MSEEELDKLENEFGYLPVIKFLRLEKFIEENYVSKDSYTNLKQIEQEHQKNNGELREEIKKEKEKNKELEKQNMLFSLNGSNIRLEQYVKEKYISKDKIREKIEEVKSLENVSIADMLESEKEFCIDILEELL